MRSLSFESRQLNSNRFSRRIGAEWGFILSVSQATLDILEDRFNSGQLTPPPESAAIAIAIAGSGMEMEIEM
jgi:hypothetical protein